MADAGTMDKQIRIERPVPDDSFGGAGSGSWEMVGAGPVWAEVQDALPSRAERLADGINIAARPARVRINFRRDVTPAMRFVLIRTVGGEEIVDRVMQIIAGPAEIENGARLEFMVEDYSTAGHGA